jgi:guanine nucleotide-binding protein subunit alpha
MGEIIENELPEGFNFNNLTHGLKYVLDSMEDMQLVVSTENREHIGLINFATDLRDDEVFPREFYEPLRQLWNDKGVQQAWERGNEAALPEKCALPFFSYFFWPGSLTVPV